jgi:hypothetical protein
LSHGKTDAKTRHGIHGSIQALFVGQPLFRPLMCGLVTTTSASATTLLQSDSDVVMSHLR